MWADASAVLEEGGVRVTSTRKLKQKRERLTWAYDETHPCYFTLEFGLSASEGTYYAKSPILEFHTAEPHSPRFTQLREEAHSPEHKSEYQADYKKPSQRWYEARPMSITRLDPRFDEIVDESA